MRIATYNVTFLFDKGNHMHSGVSYDFSEEFVEKRINYFAEEFSRIDADILFIQELGSELVLQKIIARIATPYSYFVAAPDTNGVGNAVLYKQSCECSSIPASTSMPVFNSSDVDTIGSNIPSRRDFVLVKTIYNNSPLYILGVHIKSNFAMYEKDTDGNDIAIDSQITAADGMIRSEFYRLCQARKVREVVDDIFKISKEAAAIVCGDFNSQSSNRVFSIIRGEMKKRDDALIPVLDRIPLERRFSLAGDEYSSLIDHILISKNLDSHVHALSIENEGLTSHKSNPSFPYILESDHAPVILELE